MTFKHIALFGACGQIGRSILSALVASKAFDILAIIPPDVGWSGPNGSSGVRVAAYDLSIVHQEELAAALQGIDVVISALNGKVLKRQRLIQDAAADAGVKRFYPSEYGFHHVYRKKDAAQGDGWGMLHPMWNVKAMANDEVLLHPAIAANKMSYTLIGCGDFYNQDRERVWCPWTQIDIEDNYTIHVIGNPDADIDFTHLDDFANYVVQTLLHPEKSENASLNFVSDRISYRQIAKLLEHYSGKRVDLNIISEDQMHRIVEDPDTVPEDLQGGSAFPVDFWFLVKGIQGQGRFVRPKGQIHNALFPDVWPTTFDTYLKDRFAK